MTPVQRKVTPEIDPDFVNNQNSLPADFWLPHIGKHVAFSLDGRKVLAAGESYEEVDARLAELGIDPAFTVLSYVDDGTCSLSGLCESCDGMEP